MRVFNKTGRCNLFLFAATCCSLQGQGGGPADIQKSCGNFGREFYDWYVPQALKENVGPPWDIALKDKSRAFSPELLRLLRGDSKAQAKVAGEIVFLDFDPFLSSQDPAERYVLGTITSKADRCWVEIHSISSGKKIDKPDVVPELMLKAGRWLFVNFHYGKSEYPENENLLSMLRALGVTRQQGAK